MTWALEPNGNEFSVARRIDITVHWVKGVSATFSLKTDQLRMLYWTAGIDLNLTVGEPIELDPARSARNSYPALVRQYRETAQSSGHLIIGIAPDGTANGAAGQLIDLETRGVAAAYTESFYISQTFNSGLLQTCAHEIGHMLNLAHDDVVSDFVSTMNTSDGRTTAIPTAWQLARTEAERIRTNSGNAHFLELTTPIDCYPLSFKARFLLNDYKDHQLIPWRGKFERPFDGHND